MSVLNLFLSQTQQKNRAFLANIVKVARANHWVNEDEMKLLRKIKRDLNINDLAFRRILLKPQNYPMPPLADYQERIEHLHLLTRMLLIEEDSYEASYKMLKSLAIGIGFSLNSVEQVVETAVKLVQEGVDIDCFVIEIKKVNIAA